MATDISKVTPQLMAQGLMTLREFTPMAFLVNNAYDEMAGKQGSTIDIPLTGARKARAVVPSITAPAAHDVGPTSIPLVLDKWFEDDFSFTDKDQMEVQSGIIPKLAGEALRAIAVEINEDLLGQGTQFYGIAEPVGGGTPFNDGTTKDASRMRTVLSDQHAPVHERFCVMNPEAVGSAMNVRAFQDASFGVGAAAIIDGQIDRRLGFGWHETQLIPTFTAGTGADYLVNSAGLSVGDKTIPVDGGAGGDTIVVGDILTFVGHTQTYVATTAVSGASGSVTIEPGLLAVPADNSAVSIHDVGSSNQMNLAFQRDAIAFATRPLESSQHPNAIVEVAHDAQSGLTLRLEFTREHRQDRWAWDVLWGSTVVRRESGVRLLG